MLQRGTTHGEKEREWEQVKQFGNMLIIGEYRSGYMCLLYHFANQTTSWGDSQSINQSIEMLHGNHCQWLMTIFKCNNIINMMRYLYYLKKENLP